MSNTTEKDREEARKIADEHFDTIPRYKDALIAICEKHITRIRASAAEEAIVIEQLAEERAKVERLRVDMNKIEQETWLDPKMSRVIIRDIAREALAATASTEPHNCGLLGAPLSGLSDVDEVKK